MGRNPIQVIVVALICAACIYAVFKVAANWADWRDFGQRWRGGDCLEDTRAGVCGTINGDRIPRRTE